MQRQQSVNIRHRNQEAVLSTGRNSFETPRPLRHATLGLRTQGSQDKSPGTVLAGGRYQGDFISAGDM